MIRSEGSFNYLNYGRFNEHQKMPALYLSIKVLTVYIRFVAFWSKKSNTSTTFANRCIASWWSIPCTHRQNQRAKEIFKGQKWKVSFLWHYMISFALAKNLVQNLKNSTIINSIFASEIIVPHDVGVFLFAMISARD